MTAFATRPAEADSGLGPLLYAVSVLVVKNEAVTFDLPDIFWSPRTNAGPPPDEQTDFTFASVGFAAYNEKMLSSGELPLVLRGVTGTLIRAGQGKDSEGRRSAHSSEDARRARMHSRQTEMRPDEVPVESVRAQSTTERPSKDSSGPPSTHGDGANEGSQFWMLEEVLRKSAGSARFVATNFPQKFREHATAHVSKAREMPNLMAAFAAKNATMLGKLATFLVGPRDDDKKQ